MQALRGSILVVSLCLFTASAVGEGMQLRHLAGGVTNTLEIDGKYWFQGVGDRLLVLESRSGNMVTELQLSDERGGAVCTDLLVNDDTIWVLLDDETVIELTLNKWGVPEVVSQKSADALGIVPMHLSVIEDWPIVFGKGGAVRLSDGRKIVDVEGAVSGVALSLDRGIVYAVDRRVYDAGTGEFLGSASLLAELDETANADLGTLVFTRDLGNRTEVGLMTPEGRDVDAFRGTLIVDGGSASLRTVGSRVHVCTDVGVYILGVAPRELRLLKTIEMKGAKDVGVIASNYLAICGDQGRGIYRLSVDRGGDGDTYFRQVHATSQMGRGHADRLGITIPTATGLKRYEYGGAIEASAEVDMRIDANTTELVVLGWAASIDAESGEVVILDSIGKKIENLPIRRASTVVTISGNFWFGTDDGIAIYGPDASGSMAQLGVITIAGPVVQLVPQLDGSAAFVSAAGFVGIVESNYDVALEQ